MYRKALNENDALKRRVEEETGMYRSTIDSLRAQLAISGAPLPSWPPRVTRSALLGLLSPAMVAEERCSALLSEMRTLEASQLNTDNRNTEVPQMN